jgi:hypothetical protein
MQHCRVAILESQLSKQSEGSANHELNALSDTTNPTLEDMSEWDAASTCEKM